MKNDPRTRYTEMIIKESFLDLLRCKSMSKITVKEVCDRAEINRSTFYKHFLDCYDLLDKIKEDVLAQFDQLLASIEKGGAVPALVAVLQALKQNPEASQMVKLDGSGGKFIRGVVERCYQCIDQHLPNLHENGWDEGRKAMCYAFLVGGISGVIERWMQCGFKKSPQQIAAAIMELSEIVTTGLTRK